MQWFNEPSVWQADGEQLNFTVGAKTDFWRKTHYGFIRDNGNFYYETITGNFLAEVKVIGQYQTLYDQAGLMLRLDSQTWLKCGIEFIDGEQQASAVITRDYSDWSVVPLPGNPEALWLRLERKNEAVEIKYSLDGEHYSLLRLAYLTTAETVQIGPMAASPEGEGFAVRFVGFKLTATTAS
jgi:regulation of enolase protein 1 (concanavalin A-like superfamily)